MLDMNKEIVSSKTNSSDPRSLFGLDGLVLALFALCFLILITGSGDSVPQHSGESTPENRSRRRLHRRLRMISSIPGALLVFLLGLALCFLRDPSIIKDLRFGPSKIQLVKITWEDWKIGFLRAAILKFHSQ
ncbi:hypothetical protein RJ641_024239 [Dillenia turbinata]|uniref:Uncharacterized protein n=1 Tax=Dillenia turbinata TaxID=194707 RepID=A0AAN8UJ92_9MAGN